MGEVKEKLWGWSEALVVSPAGEVHRIDINAGGYCSIHYHRTKHNVFVLMHGAIDIYEWVGGADTNGDPSRVHHLVNPGDSYAVPPGVLHQFRALKQSRAIEVYWPDPLGAEDIVRFTEGGQ